MGDDLDVGARTGAGPSGDPPVLNAVGPSIDHGRATTPETNDRGDASRTGNLYIHAVSGYGRGSARGANRRLAMPQREPGWLGSDDGSAHGGRVIRPGAPLAPVCVWQLLQAPMVWAAVIARSVPLKTTFA